jgi:seryl-tRNA synthetase
MLDLKFIRSHLEEVKQALMNRGQEFLLDDFESLDEMRRLLLGEVESRRQERNSLSEEVGRLKKAKQDAAALMERVREINQELKDLEQDLQDKEAMISDFLLNLPNLPHASVPVGVSSDDNPVVRTWGEPPRFDFPAKPHWEVGEFLGILDFETAAKITGSRFALLKGPASRLERALINFMLDLHTQQHGYLEVWPPFMINTASALGTGQLPKFKEDLFKLEGWDYYLAPTAEVPVTNIHRDDILKEESLPIYYTAFY